MDPKRPPPAAPPWSLAARALSRLGLGRRHAPRVSAFALCVLAAAVSPAAAAIGLDAASSNAVTTSSSITISHATGNGADRLMLVGVSMTDGSGTRQVTSVTYGGTNLTFVGGRTDSPGNTVRCEIWRLTSPQSGTANVVVTLNGNSEGIVAGVVTFTGVDQTTPLGSFNSAQGISPTPSITLSSANGELVFDTVAFREGLSLNVGANQTQQWSRADGANKVRGAGSTEPGAASVNMSWSQPGGSAKEWVIGAVPIIPVSVFTVSGTVYEDVNYGGGSGRDRASSSGVVRSGARVELYDNAGAYVAAAATDLSGNYSFTGLVAGSYTVRVVDNTVTSSRGGSGLLPVLTYRTNAGSGTAVGVTDYVGGQNPEVADAPYGAAGAVMNTTTGVFTAGISGTAQSFASATISTGNVSGVDFGFNFDTVVNTNDAGRGSLRQFIINANALGNGGLAIQGQTPGKEVSIFMIGNGQAHPGLRTGLPNLLSASGVAVITPATVLPAISDADTALDGTTQTTNVGNTNSVVLGSGGAVGVDGLALNQVAGPEVEIRGLGSPANGIRISANNATIRGLAIYGFGTAAGQGGIRIDDTFTGALIESNVLGSTATSFSDPGAGSRNWVAIDSEGGDSGTIRNNLIGFVRIRGIMLANASSNWTVAGNEVRDNGLETADGDGISIDASSTNTVTGNLFIGSSSQGIVVTVAGATGNVLTNNTVTGNGVGIPSGLVQSTGITLRTGAISTVLDRNVVNANYGAGVQVNNGANGTRMTRNSFFANGTITARNGGAPTGQIGIDLNSPTDDINLGTVPFYTLNDSGDTDTGGNGLLNFPILSTATAAGGNLTLTGFARPGSTIELFLAENPADPRGFGEGKTYLTTLVEGSAADLDNTTGTYGPAAINGIAQGTDTTNRFRFVIPLPGGAGIGSLLTSTATIGNDTSEFSGNVTIGAASYQPDAMVKLSTEGAGAYATNNVYEATAATQVKSQGVVNASTAIYNVLFQNDGNVSDNLAVTQAAADNCAGFTVQYVDNTSTDRTAAVTGAGYTITGMAAGADTTWTLRVTPAGTLNGGSPACGISVTATSGGNSTKVDQVRAMTSSTSANLTLLKSADRATVEPGQDITYTVNTSNGGGLTPASAVVVADPIPAYTGFKVGSATFSPGSSTLSGTPSFSSDNGASWTYTPVSGGCAAPAGYDFCVTNVRWTTTGNMPTGTSFTVNFVVRVK